MDAFIVVTGAGVVLAIFVYLLVVPRRMRDRVRRRERWIDDNRNTSVLRFNCVEGVYVILSPDAYYSCVQVTQDARVNGVWDHHNVLMPSPDSFIFSTVRAKERIRDRVGLRGVLKVAGLASDIQVLQRSGFCLKMSPDIFVPFINESVLTFAMQRKLMGWRPAPIRRGWERLIDSMIPWHYR